MKKRYIDTDEWYPVYSINNEGYGSEAEFTKEELVRIGRVFKEFDEVQDLLGKKYEKI